MYKNKLTIKDKPRNNIAGLNVSRLRKEHKWSQNDLAIQLQNIGHDIHKNGVQQMEAGSRFITDIELMALAQVFNVEISQLLSLPDNATFDSQSSHTSRQ